MGVSILMSEYINNIIYGVKSFVTGMRLTFQHFSKKKELVATLQYPHEKWPIPERSIGFEHQDYNLIRSRLHVDIDDCIACMQCERACPVDCIKIDSIKPPKDNDYDCGLTSNDTQKKMVVSRFTIDMSECMYCNLCVFPCPEECIYMVGGPNASKHEIDYEFSQYKRDGMIFEFADATDEDIIKAGGKKWIEQRDSKDGKIKDGVDLKGIVEIEEVIPEKVEISEESKEGVAAKAKEEAGLNIKSFDKISDKMCRGIAKKSFTASKRLGKDNIAILSDVAKALDSYGKLNSGIKEILNTISNLDKAKDVKVEKNISSDTIKDDNNNIKVISEKKKDVDIKDLNSIEDKMARGIAKKAFVAAKRAGSNKIDEIQKALGEAGKMTDDISSLLNTFVVENSQDINSGENKGDTITDNSNDDSTSDELFAITDLNVIEDKMVRGLSKKIYTAAKRAGKGKMELIQELRSEFDKNGKLNDELNKLLGELGK